jgi:DNA-binding PadR family transcriptional regulator
MNRLSLLIIGILLHHEATNATNAMSLAEIIECEEFQIKANTIYKQLKDLESKSFVACGLKDGKAHTYYVTLKGINFLKEIKKQNGEEL